MFLLKRETRLFYWSIKLHDFIIKFRYSYGNKEFLGILQFNSGILLFKL